MLRKFQQQTFIQASFWISAATVGTIAIIYAQIINAVLKTYFSFFDTHPYVMTAATPILFVLATYLVVRFAPQAKGSGIPQVLEAISHTKHKDFNAGNNSLVSIRTALIKVFSSLIGFIAGASIGREGPTVQISASIFSWVGHKMKKFSVHIDPQSYLIAGGAAGVAAAFNTPLAGVTFALEEIADGVFSQFKQPVMFSIIIAGITAQAFVGDYLYFGHPTTIKPTLIVIPEALLIGVVCGLLGGLFARILAQKDFKFKFKHWAITAFVCGIICSLIALFSNGLSSGSGYEVVKQFMDNDQGQIPILFALEKFLSTIFSYFSGMAGGIFSPTLSIGAGIGYTVGSILTFINLKTCALIGMVAFFSAVVQAPLT
ncbi:MAG: chloride channel protein, partial [Bdellovibrionaceae bacterium]|nr:chloride channel protein [Pseudobdellovibrionaceae bacterium]